MISANLTELRELSAWLDQVLELPEEQRMAWLEAQADIPEPIRARLRKALDQSEPSEPLPALSKLLDGCLLPDTDELHPGDLVGDYQLVRPLGQGGMGAVWLAERTDGLIKRQVALKLPLYHLPRGSLIERFKRERDILAGLQHSNIARLYDAGLSSDGRPYLVLEYVEGTPWLQYCETQQLSLEQRLALFQQVLSAVQYAHSRLVLHRDIKPGNILVDAQGQAHLLDFGIGKLMADDGQADSTELTKISGSAHTPRYAAPEQILGQPLSIATDIYSLGVLLYETLTGVLPYASVQDNRVALEQAVLSQDPAKPSSMAKLPWSKKLKGDLDTIMLKALKKEPAQRYATVAALADDIQRYLRGEAVLARPDSASYRLGKLIKRHRLSAAFAASAVLALVVGLGVALWQAEVARQSAVTAEKEARKAKAVQGFIQGIFEANTVLQPDPIKARQTTARELLDLGAERIEKELADVPEAKADILHLLATLYAQMDMNDKGLAFEEKRLELAKALYPEGSDALYENYLYVTLLTSQVESEPARQRALLDGLAKLTPDDNPERVATLAYLETNYWNARNPVLAAQHAKRAMQAIAQLPADYEDAPWIISLTVNTSLLIGECDLARTYLDQANRFTNQQAEPDIAASIGLDMQAARISLCKKDWLQAKQSAEVALQNAVKVRGELHIDTLAIQAILARALFEMGQAGQGNSVLAAAEAKLDQVLQQSTSTRKIAANTLIGEACLSARQFDCAENYFQQARAVAEPILEEVQPSFARILRGQARALLGLGKLEQAKETLDQAIAARQKVGIESHYVIAEETEIQQALDSASPHP